MSEMLARATAAASNAWHECETCPGEMYVKEARIVARAALLAALDPEDERILDECGEALIDEYQRMMREEGGWNSGGLVRVVIAALRAQCGERE